MILVMRKLKVPKRHIIKTLNVTQSLKWYYQSFKSNTGLNACVSIASSNFHETLMIEPGYKQTKISKKGKQRK